MPIDHLRIREPRADDPVLIGISFFQFGAQKFSPNHGICREALIRGVSKIQRATFTFQTGYLIPRVLEEIELLRKFGFVVIEPPSDWQSRSAGDWQNKAIAKRFIEIEGLVRADRG